MRQIFRRLPVYMMVIVLLLGRAMMPAFAMTEGFTLSFRPDSPLRKYAQGKLGIVQSTYARSYLYVAYRYLTGKPLSNSEQAAVVSLWDERLYLIGEYDRHEAWVSVWRDQRKKVPGLPEYQSIFLTRPVSAESPYGEQFCNCGRDAFVHAADILKERIGQLGVNSPRVKEWVLAQDQVFVNCDGSPERGDREKPTVSIPACLPEDADPAAKADRAYQIAAAYFYALDFDKARQEFDSIASDGKSPYRNLAHYLAERANIRKATLSSSTIDLNMLQEEKKRLVPMLSDSSMAPYKKDLQSLIDFINAKVEPQKRLDELTKKLSSPKPDTDFRQDLWDFTDVFDRLVDWSVYQDKEVGSENVPEELKNFDLTDWMSNFQLKDDQSRQYSLHRWKEKKALPWLISAISKVKGTDAEAPALMAAGGKLNAQSPAYLTVAYHLVRLMLEQHKAAAARVLLNSLLTRPDLPPSARNAFLMQRLPLDRTLSEFIGDAVLYPSEAYEDTTYNSPDFVKVEAGDSYPRRDPAMPGEVLEVLNQKFPLSVLAKVATEKTLPPQFKHRIAVSAFVRAIILSNYPVAQQMASLLIATSPKMAPYLQAWMSAKSNAEKKFLAALFLIKFQETDPDITNPYLGEHWWWNSWSYTPYYDWKPSFITAAEKKQAAAELKKLDNRPDANSYLIPTIIAYAKSNPSYPRVPEALHLAVRATHYGFRDDKISGYSKQCYMLLHNKYPGNQWTVKTKYWY